MSVAPLLADVFQARERLAPYLTPTPLEPAPGLGPHVWLKLENRNLTRSFKIRGALNALLALDLAARERGVIACSSGNHAQGIAHAAALKGMRARLLVPTHTPRRKLAGVRRHGAEVLPCGAHYDETEAIARRMARTERMTFVSPYNDTQVIAGAGTIGLELLESLPQLTRVLVPAGGGGLVGGIALTLKARRPQVEVIAICARAAPALYNRLRGQNLPWIHDTLAEALSGDIERGSLTVPLARRYVDRALLVEETEIAAAMRWLLLEHGLVAEGGGAVALAALLRAAPEPGAGDTVALVSGGNVDESTLRRVLCSRKGAD